MIIDKTGFYGRFAIIGKLIALADVVQCYLVAGAAFSCAVRCHRIANHNRQVSVFEFALNGDRTPFGEWFDGENRADRAGLSAIAHSWLATKANSVTDDATRSEMVETPLLEHTFNKEKGYRPDEQRELTAGKGGSLKSGLIDWSSRSNLMSRAYKL